MKKLSVLMIALIACFMIACSAVEFKVNFVVDGETIKTVSTSGAEAISIPENPTKEGYVFDGWYWDKDTWERPFTANSLLDVPLSSDMNVYCKWTLETIHVESITLNSTKLTLNIGDVETLTATILPNNATDSSVTWSSSDSSIVSVENGKVTAHKMGTATITATSIDKGHTATCEVEVIADMLLFKTLTVDDDKIYGTVSNSTLTFSFLKEITEMGEATYTVYKEITCESPILGKTIPLNEGENKVYILQTIGKKIALFEVTIYRLPMHEVSFDSIGGTSIPSQMIEEGSKITAPSEAPVRTGYTFAGWDFDFETAIMEPTTVKAKWTPNNNIVTFNSNGGSGTMSSQAIATDSSANLTANSFTKTGYTFVGWSTSKNGAVEYTDGATYTMGTNSSYTLYSVWEANQNTVIFNSNGGSGTMSSLTIATDSSARLTANRFTKAGYTFKGWSTSENGAVEYTDGATYTMGTNSSYTLYAVWEANQNTVIFNSNGGSGTMSSQVIATDSSASLTANSFTKAGYTFKGWSTSKNRAVEYTDGATYTMGTNSSYTLYAVWEANKNTVIFNSNGGSGTMSSQVIATDSSASLTANSFTKAGYTFKGWSTSESGSVRYYDGATYTMGTNSSYTLYAVWEINVYSIMYELNEGINDIGNPSTFTINDLPLVLSSPTLECCEFLGWYLQDGTTKITQINSVGNITISAKWRGLKFTEYNNYAEVSGYVGDVSSVVVPSTYNGKAVTSITNNAFKNCTSLVSIEIPNSVTSIGNSAFFGCAGLTSITIPDSVTSIGYSAFSDCPIENATIPTIAISDVLNSNLKTVVINGGTSIGNYAFQNCASLTSVTIPDSVTSIGYNAFSGCTSLTSVTIGNGVTSIGNSAFENCTSLTSITIPDNVTFIGSYAFYRCEKLTSIVIPDSVTSIGEMAFYGCTGLTSITIPDSVTSIGYRAFYNCPIENATIPTIAISYVLNSNLKTVVINGGTSIGDWAFYGCEKLSSIVIPDSVTSIGERAFYNCPIENATIPTIAISYVRSSILKTIVINGGTSIGNSAFRDCTDLTSIVIPDSVTSIGSGAFYNCTSLSSVTIPDSVTTIGSDAFYNCTSLTIYCEATSTPSGWDSGWNKTNRPVVWGHTHAYENGSCVCGKAEN